MNTEALLHVAIQWDKIKLARILVENGADTNAENNHGMTPLHIPRHILTKRKFRIEVMFSISRYCC